MSPKFPNWLKPPKASGDGTMPLRDHLREIRYRLIVSLSVIILASILAAIWSEQLIGLLMQPYTRAVAILSESDPKLQPIPVIEGVIAPFALLLKVSVTAGVICSSPIWLHQLWSFIVPALRQAEKRNAAIFLATATPLFILGVGMGYYFLPLGISMLLAFTPASVPVVNLLDMNAFLSLVVQLMMIFGLGFLMPVVVVAMNFIGVLKAKKMSQIRKYVIFGIFCFGALATPADPYSMLALALPMVALYLIAELIARIHDRREMAAAKRNGELES